MGGFRKTSAADTTPGGQDQDWPQHLTDTSAGLREEKRISAVFCVTGSLTPAHEQRAPEVTCGDA